VTGVQTCALPIYKQAKQAAPKKKAAAKKKRSKVEQIVTEDFEAKLAKHTGVRRDVAGIIHLDITGKDGGQWTADLTRADEFISPGLAGTPKLMVRCSASDFTALVKGRKDPKLAVVAGDLELVPMDLELVTKLAPLFS
jgi:hypothetical protein